MGSTIGVSGVILLVILALILFGPKKLPELGRAMGNTLREFKNATRGLTKDDEEEEQAKNKPEQAAAAPEQAVIDREKLEREIRERLERERLEQEIREKLEKERLSAEQDKPQA